MQETIHQLCVTPTILPKRWRLTLPISDATKEIEEVVLRIQGIITHKELPPIQREKYRKRKAHETKFMRQGVQITGVNSSSFAQSIQTITKLFSLMSRGFQEDDMHPWKPNMFMTYPSINISNRYFYDSRDCQVQASIPLGDSIDPDHYLAGLALASGVIHTVDNQVEYFKLTPDKK
jgi:hypothetical protein